MKIRRNILMLGVAIAIGAITGGCTPDGYKENTEEKEDNGGGSSIGGKDNNNPPTEDDNNYSDGSDINTSSFNKYDATFTFCGYMSLGSLDSVEGYALFLADDNYDWDAEEAGDGNWAIVEIFTKEGNGIAPGKYCLNDTMNAGTAYICEIGDDETVSGAMFGQGEYAYVCPNAGYVEISKSGSNYTIKIKYIDETYNGVFEGSFTGTLIEYEDSGSEEETAEFTQCEAEFYGEYNGAGDWGIYLGDDETDMSDLSGGAWAMIELFSSSTSYSSTLPEGTFTIDDSEKAGTVASIYEYDEYYYGTMYGIDDSIYVGATSGTIKISKDGTSYTIEMNFIDDDYDTSFKSTYTGKVTVSDCSSKSMRKNFYRTEEASKRTDCKLPSFKVCRQ